MKKILRNLFFLSTTLFVNKVGLSQTIINYETWTGASGCNIFSSSTNVPATINGSNTTIAHLTAIGQPTYDNVNKSVNIISRISGGQNEGTEYRVTTTFKQGYSYAITITAARIMSQQTGPNVLLRLDMNNGGSGNNTTCNGSGIIDASGSGDLKHSQQIGSNSFSDYVFNYSALSAQQVYLMVAAIPPAASVSQTILIRKIKIDELPPAATFTLSPSSLTIPCGSAAAQTFTVTNVNNTPNVTNHLWNLGSANNGWLYNGNPAPQTISTGTTNALTLTPVCGSAPGNINVTVTAGGNNYQTNAATIAAGGPPTFSISGNNVVCVSGIYSIPNLPCGATVNRSLSGQPGPLATLSCTTCPQTTVTKGTGSGNEFLTATVTVCGTTQTTPIKQIRIGGYTQSSPFNTNGPHIWCKNQVATVSVDQNAYPELTSFSWGSVPAGWTYITGGGSGNYIVLRATNSTSPPTGTINVTGTDVCGNNTTVGHFMAKSNCTSFRISPNPATELITIEEYDDNTGNLITESNIKAVEIINRMGVLSFRQQYPAKSIGSRLSLRVGNLSNDIYAVRIFDGLEWKSYKVIVNR